ncbi:MAG TPA: hypothetical protein VD997_01225 [Phycisphaerales bacterium]|nr:hypothetical protein [Phycisphaerales bacterium]
MHYGRLMGAAALVAAMTTIPAAAQDVTPIPNVDKSTIPHIYVDASTKQVLPYAPRLVVQDVYDSDANGECIGTFGHNHLIEDVRFSNGPWSSSIDKPLMEVQLLISNSFGQISDYDILVKVWQNASFTSNPMVAAGAVPLTTLGPVAIRNAPDLAYLNLMSNGLPLCYINGDHAYVEVFVLAPGSNQLASVTGGLVVTHQNDMPVGSTTDPWGRDRNADGVMQGGPLDAPMPNEHVRSIFGGAPCTGNAVIADLVLRGIAPATEPPATEITLQDSGLTVTAPLGPGEIKWYKFEVPGNVTDARRTFLDIDTEGSQLGPVNQPVLALFDGVGVLLATNRDSGSDLQAQLSFGVGNRPAFGNGLAFDGMNGELTFAFGPYYLGVGSFPAARVGNGWLLTGASENSGTVRVNFRTNATFAGPLAPSAEPNFIEINNGQTVLAPGLTVPPVNPGVPGALWYKFTTCGADGSTPESYLDIDFTGSDSPQTADQVAFVFNSSGNVVASSNDEGPWALPQFSFGATWARPSRTGNPADPVFAGQNGSLPAGTYYLASGFAPMTSLSNAATDGRWHVRPRSGDDLNIRVDFLTGVVQCGPTCGTSDFNGDGDSGTDQDIEAFFTCIGGTCCPTCYAGGSDFNGDGDAGTDQDIEAFFRVLGGHPC